MSEIPLLSLAAIPSAWVARTQRPDTSGPLAVIAGRVGSSTVTATDWVWNAAPGPQLDAAHTRSCCTEVTPAGRANGMVAPRMSSAVSPQARLGRRPKTKRLRGWASIIAPQLQLPLARRPPHRSDEMVVPAGAVNMWDEFDSAGTVTPVMRLLMPAFRPPPVGHVE